MTKHSAELLPRLDRLLLDTDVNPLVGRYLQALQFDVTYALSEGIDIRDDVRILRHARSTSRVMVTHDRFRKTETKVRLYRDLYEAGGCVIQLGGAAQGSPLEAVGRILIHRDDWLSFFHEHDGLMVLSKNKATPIDRANCLRKCQYVSKQFEPPVAPKVRAKRAAAEPRRRARIPSDQPQLDLQGQP